jgi:hypothetical protein
MQIRDAQLSEQGAQSSVEEKEVECRELRRKLAEMAGQLSLAGEGEGMERGWRWGRWGMTLATPPFLFSP